MRYSAAVRVGLILVWMITFCSKAENFQEKSLSLGSFLSLVTVVKMLSDQLGAATAAQEVGTGVLVPSVGAGLPCSWMTACCRYSWVGPVVIDGCCGVYWTLG